MVPFIWSTLSLCPSCTHAHWSAYSVRKLLSLLLLLTLRPSSSVLLCKLLVVSSRGVSNISPSSAASHAASEREGRPPVSRAFLMSLCSSPEKLYWNPDFLSWHFWATITNLQNGLNVILSQSYHGFTPCCIWGCALAWEMALDSNYCCETAGQCEAKLRIPVPESNPGSIS